MLIWQKLMMAEAAPAGFSCNITLGSGSGFYGYDTGVLVGTFGSIDGEPIPGETLVTAVWNGSNNLSVAFDGDILATLTTLNVYVNSVNYGGSGEWDNSSGIYTVLERNVAVPETSGTYLFELK
jgi:hypothetical protein